MSKLAVITGGTKGIGRAIVEKFTSAGFDVFTCSRNSAELLALKKSVESIHKVQVHTAVADLSKRKEVAAFVDSVLTLKQPIEVLVNNAGYFAPGQVSEEADGTLEGMIEANVYSAYYVTKDLVPTLKKQRSGHVFNLCSIASIAAYPNGGSYTISKFALLGFSKVLREELKQYQIRVTAVLPGATLTPSWEGSNLPEERLMRPEDVADAIFGAYSLSPRSVVEEILIRPMLGDL